MMTIVKPILPLYEHPFNERVRLLLRLEIIFAQAARHASMADQYETQQSLDSLFALLNISNRYELKSELLRELERIKTLLTQLKKNADVNNQAIGQTIEQLQNCADGLHRMDSKNIDYIRNIEFLNTIKNRNVHDTGTFLFELPELQYWLLQPQEHRQQQIATWFDDFMPIEQTVYFILNLIRQSAVPQHLTAHRGVHIKTIDGRSNNYQLLSIDIGSDNDVYPRVSGDKFRFAIRFMEKNQASATPVQTQCDIGFRLGMCGI